MSLVVPPDILADLLVLSSLIFWRIIMTITTLADLTPKPVFPAVLYQEADGLLHDERSAWAVAVWTPQCLVNAGCMSEIPTDPRRCSVLPRPSLPGLGADLLSGRSCI
jgi:hypothetical protein